MMIKNPIDFSDFSMILGMLLPTKALQEELPIDRIKIVTHMRTYSLVAPIAVAPLPNHIM